MGRGARVGCSVRFTPRRRRVLPSTRRAKPRIHRFVGLYRYIHTYVHLGTKRRRGKAELVWAEQLEVLLPGSASRDMCYQTPRPPPSPPATNRPESRPGMLKVNTNRLHVCSYEDGRRTWTRRGSLTGPTHGPRRAAPAGPCRGSYQSGSSF